MKMASKNWFDKFSETMDQNIRGVHYGIYAAAGLGLVLALRSIRPFKKFRVPSDIPQHFIDKRMRFSGKVIRAQGGKDTILHVDHFPVVPLPLRSSSTELPIQVASVDITPNGGIWLSSLVQGNNVDFIPLRRDTTSVPSIVYRGRQDVGQHLVTIGFATVGSIDLTLSKDPIYSKYYKGLLSCERKAENKGAGIWQDQKSGIWQKTLNRVTNIRYSIL